MEVGKPDQGGCPGKAAPLFLWLAAGRPRPGKAAAWLALLAAVACAGAAIAAAAQTEPIAEYRVKAAFLFNFAKFVEWPAGTFTDVRDPIVIGILGEDPFGGSLAEMVAGKSVNGRELVIRRMKRAEEFRDCQILFISSSEKKALSAVLESLRGRPVLTVSDMDGFFNSGGAVQLFLKGDRVQFAVNPESASQGGLRISSKLLALSRPASSAGKKE